MDKKWLEMSGTWYTSLQREEWVLSPYAEEMLGYEKEHGEDLRGWPSMTWSTLRCAAIWVDGYRAGRAAILIIKREGDRGPLSLPIRTRAETRALLGLEVDDAGS